MTAPSIRAILAGAGAVAMPALAAPKTAVLTVKGEAFVLTLPDGRTLGSADLAGAELTTEQGVALRIDAVAPSKERPGLLLHSFSVQDPDTHAWTPLCDADAYGRRAGFPVAGRWDEGAAGGGRYVKDARHWFLACTSGSRGKCVLWGYDPWGKGPKGQDLAPYYRACQYTVRANYDGQGQAHTRNGTRVDVSDIAGLQTADTAADPAFAFEAGWGTRGAVCVARTRWPELLSLAALLKSAPRLGGRCDVGTARRRGALIFTRVMRQPVIGPPPKL